MTSADYRFNSSVVSDANHAFEINKKSFDRLENQQQKWIFSFFLFFYFLDIKSKNKKIEFNFYL